MKSAQLAKHLHFQEPYLTETIEQPICLDGSSMDLRLAIDVEPRCITQRVLVGLWDSASQKGIQVAVYPATGEVCDVSNGAGVLGYLSSAPVLHGDRISFEVNSSVKGENMIADITVNGETFWYPAFSVQASSEFRPRLGIEDLGADGLGLDDFPTWSYLSFGSYPSL